MPDKNDDKYDDMEWWILAGRHEYSIIPDSEGYTLTDDENRGSSYVGIYPTIGKAVRVARKRSSQKGEG